ncbi:winged helix-turn-helix domain-containing protein [Allomuricauda sp. SCSIO 65647]|uniref:winged helix-turn-helix domain-containing protein n=1 Tax=Allomuricauda sp. SCSIO 65647 TaxID=2908843 RepID=UPI001F3092F1|nr:winged helix-turn-helix domain-containing protein [Muricauda sp. SCSIO 65647]UJH68920.1 winged helix-turn-helix domain-containing protein [Muricauda sp. SCSIO 65647]
MNKFKSAAIQILKKAGKPLHYKEITKLALEKGILETHGKTPAASMNAQIVTDINAKGSNSNFIKTAPATYALNLKKKQQEEVKSVKSEIFEKIGSGFIGKAGEHFVTSELLFRGYNASIMSVDIGMDIIATKNNKLFSLQVKTSNLLGSNSYIFDMRKVSLERDHAGNVFYVFVMIHPNNKKSAVILTPNKIEELIHSNAIKNIEKYGRFRVVLKIRDNRIFIGTLDNPIDYYWNNWSIIK